MDAPIEVIQAAYRTLAKKYHPDINQSNPNAERIMQIINASYEVLSDPVKREQHDAWIRKENWRRKVESTKAASNTKCETRDQPQQARKNKAGAVSKESIVRAMAVFKQWSRFIFRLAIYFVIGAVVLGWGIAMFDTVSSERHSTSNPSKSPTTKTSTNFKLPELNPNCAGQQTSYVEGGRPWPVLAQVLSVRDKRKGLSSLLLDNSANDQDLYVKLARSQDEITHNYAMGVFIPARKQLKLSNIAPGNYIVKMMNIADGCTQVSPIIELIEKRTDKGIEYSDHSLTFYPVVNGNTYLRSMPSSQF